MNITRVTLPQPSIRDRWFKPEAPRRYPSTRTVAGLAIASVLAVAGAYIGLGHSDGTPTPVTTGRQGESVASSLSSFSPNAITAIQAYMEAVTEGRGAPSVKVDVDANPQAAALQAYVGAYPLPGLKTLIEGRP